MSYNFIETFTNKQYEFLNPQVDQVCIEDISQALSMICRYSGHVKSFYSVAEHSCIVSDKVFALTGDYQLAFDALLHDASEAYLTDIPRPIKPHLNNYFDIEVLSESCIQKALGCNPMNDLIKRIDTNIVRDEAEQLFVSVPSWASDYELVNITVESMPPEKANSEFMNRYNVLKDALGK